MAGIRVEYPDCIAVVNTGNEKLGLVVEVGNVASRSKFPRRGDGGSDSVSGVIGKFGVGGSDKDKEDRRDDVSE